MAEGPVTTKVPNDPYSPACISALQILPMAQKFQSSLLHISALHRYFEWKSMKSPRLAQSRDDRRAVEMGYEEEFNRAGT